MKAIDNFLVEATKQYGENATISIDQAKQVYRSSCVIIKLDKYTIIWYYNSISDSF